MRAHNEPVSWWGWHGYNQPTPLSIVQIIQSGSVPARLAALLWIALERGASLIIASDPPMGGKTTTLTALMSAFAPPRAIAYYTRGIGETFQVPPTSDEEPVYLMINEISDHIPVYTWSAYARRAFELLSQGYRLTSTMHADTVDEVIAILEEELNIPRSQIAHLNLVMTLWPLHRDGRLIRRTREAALLRPGDSSGGEDDLVVHTLATWDPRNDTYSVLDTPESITAVAAWTGYSIEGFTAELEKREEFLNGLMHLGVTSIRAVADAVVRYRGVDA